MDEGICDGSTDFGTDPVGKRKLAKGWKEGPMPRDTWGWGGVVLKKYAEYDGFYFADFRGDHAVLVHLDGAGDERVEADDVAAYNNLLTLPRGMRGVGTPPQDMPVSEFRQYAVNFIDDALGHSWFVRGETRKFLQGLRSFATVMTEDQLRQFQGMVPR